MITIETYVEIGYRVWSKITGNVGSIIEYDRDLVWKQGRPDSPIGKMKILWDNGKISHHPLWDPDYGPKDGEGACFKNCSVLEGAEVGSSGGFESRSNSGMG